MSIITFTNHPITNTSRIEFKRKGVSFIKKITAKGSPFLEGELLKELTYPYSEDKVGMLLEITYTDTKEITLKDGTKKLIKKNEYVFVNFKNKTSTTLSYRDFMEIIDNTDEFDLYK